MAINVIKPPVVKMSLEGMQKTQKDHDDLMKNREEILKRLQLAREMGDLSENGAYKAARAELSDCDRNLRRLNYILRFGVVPKKNNDGTVGFGSIVTLLINGKEMTYTMVSEHESNPMAFKVSESSPIGKAMLNKKVGDVITVLAPVGEVKYKILKIN